MLAGSAPAAGMASAAFPAWARASIPRVSPALSATVPAAADRFKVAFGKRAGFASHLELTEKLVVRSERDVGSIPKSCVKLGPVPFRAVVSDVTVSWALEPGVGVKAIAPFESRLKLPYCPRPPEAALS